MTRLHILALGALAGFAAFAAQGAVPAGPRLAFPVACVLGRTCEIQHYVDRDPGPGVRDYRCATQTDQAHNGIDIRVPDMMAQRRGVDVLASAAGTVARVRDGVADISVRAPGASPVANQECGNGVAISHGGGWETQYCHMARGSIRVKSDVVPGLAEVPLALHASYSREEILAAVGWTSQGRTPSTMREGVAWCPDINTDVLLITLKKTDTDYSPTTMYRDFALSPELFHWESQSTTNSNSPTGQRYINHRKNGTNVVLFVREAKTNSLGASPYVFLGPADYVTHEGSRPMAVTWRLHRAMPMEIFLASRAAVA